MKWIRYLCGGVGLVGLILFIGGLAYSIWENTDSIAFPVIVALVAVMAAISIIGDLRSGSDADG